MSISPITTNAAKMPIPEASSDRPIMFWSTLVGSITDNFQFTLNNNIFFPQPQNPTIGFSPSICRGMNITVDLTVEGGNLVTYMTEANYPCTYVVNYSGIHPIIHTGIISIGNGIGAFQSGI